MTKRPRLAPDLLFDAHDVRTTFDLHGDDCGPCGPGAIAAVAGVTLPKAIEAIGPKWPRLKGTTEIMLTQALDGIGRAWSLIPPGQPSFGLVRIQWTGPWMSHPDPFEKLRHSHWVGATLEADTRWIFDINAISAGGWITLREWDNHLRPWLLDRAEPRATGGWHICDAYEVIRPWPDDH